MALVAFVPLLSLLGGLVYWPCALIAAWMRNMDK